LDLPTVGRTGDAGGWGPDGGDAVRLTGLIIRVRDSGSLEKT
jgi:hypothetical protein